ncbi:MAG: LPXTG cell wall anchor domain-containing protein, partial [Streptomycetaceae bacterium]|nr:LPXTG cell wall anchor domain-containing protein [Streptomycetaceae bacterium]
GETEGLSGRKPAGGSAYVCAVPPGDPWKPATERDFAFRVRLDAAFAGVRTSVVAVSGTGHYEAADLTFDITGGTPATGAASAGNQPGDAGPELAETGGSSSSTPVIAGIAGGLLAVAGGAFVVVRRRKAAAAV